MQFKSKLLIYSRIIIIFIVFQLLNSCDNYKIDNSFRVHDSINIKHTNRLIVQNGNIYIGGGCYEIWSHHGSRYTFCSQYGVININSNGSLNKEHSVIFPNKNRCYFLTKIGDRNFVCLKSNFDKSNDELTIIENGKLISLKPNSIINSFGFNQDKNSYVRGIEVDESERIIVFGSFNTYNEAEAHNIIRINKNGSIDKSFNIDRKVFLSCDFISNVAILKNGKMIIAGEFKIKNGNKVTHGICRLNQDGSVDTMFSRNSTGFDGFLNGIRNILVEDSTIYISGNFQQFNGKKTYTGFIRLDQYGNLFKDFKSYYEGFDNDLNEGDIYKSERVNDSMLVLIGYFDKFNGKPCQNYIVFVNKNGELLENIRIDLCEGKSISDIKVVNQDTIYLLGSFYGKNVNGKPPIIRIVSNPLVFFKQNAIYIIILISVFIILLFIWYFYLKKRIN